MPEPAAGMMRMSADDDDQANQQHELADPGMAETDHSVLETPRPYNFVQSTRCGTRRQ